MRLLAALLFSLALLYAGGLYRVPALAVAAVSLWAAAALLAGAALCARRGFSVSVRLPEDNARRLVPFTCTVEIENRSVFP